MSVTSVANDKDDNEIILEPVHRFYGIFLMAEENPGKAAERPVIASNGVPYLQKEIRRIAQ